MKSFFLLVTALCCGSSFVSLAGQDLLGIDQNGDVYTLDSALGSGGFLGSSGFTGTQSLAVHPDGQHYSIAGSDLIQIDKSSGHGTFVALTGLTDVCALAFSENRKLFAVENGLGSSDDFLYEINPFTGATTLIGSMGRPGIEGLVFYQGVMYAFDVDTGPIAGEGLLTVNPSSGQTTDVDPGVGGLSTEVQDLANLDNTQLFGGFDELYEVSVVDGRTTLVGSGGYAQLRGLAAAEPPKGNGSLCVGCTAGACTDEYAGVFFNVYPLSADLDITGIELAIEGNAGDACVIDVYVRNGGFDGFEDNAAAWTFLGNSSTTVAGGGNTNFPWPGTVTLNYPNTYGVFINLTTYGPNQKIGCTFGAGAFGTSHLGVTSGAGKGLGGFGGATTGDVTMGGCLLYEYGGPTNFGLFFRGSCPGFVTAHAFGATPQGQVAFVYALGSGTFPIPNGQPCAGLQMGLDPLTVTLGGVVPADNQGHASISANAPPGVCGILVMQAVDISSCALSNTANL